MICPRLAYLPTQARNRLCSPVSVPAQRQRQAKPCLLPLERRRRLLSTSHEIAKREKPITVKLCLTAAPSAASPCFEASINSFRTSAGSVVSDLLSAAESASLSSGFFMRQSSPHCCPALGLAENLPNRPSCGGAFPPYHPADTQLQPRC
jgi:hypothetical protein